MISDEQILQAVENTRSQWAELLDKQEADDLGQWLVEAATGDPEAIRQTTNRVLELLQEHPQARTRVTAALGIKGDLESLRAYISPAGEPSPTSATVLMVCPQDPTHYRKHLRQKGIKLFCPEHGVPLVPADSIETKE
jgi:hypothetical protein